MPEVVLIVRRPFGGSGKLANSQACKSTFCQPYAGLHWQGNGRYWVVVVVVVIFEEVVDPPQVD